MRSEDNFPLKVGTSSFVGLYRPRWDLLIAASVIAVLPVMLLFVFLRKVFIGGLGQIGSESR